MKSQSGDRTAQALAVAFALSFGLFGLVVIKPESLPVGMQMIRDVIAHPLFFIPLVVVCIGSGLALLSLKIAKHNSDRRLRAKFADANDRLIRPLRLHEITDTSLQHFASLSDITARIHFLARMGDEGAVQLVDCIIAATMSTRASDIHIEPGMESVQVKYRIDGVLTDIGDYPKMVHNRVITRLRVMSNLTIYKKGQPQDGRIDVRLGNRTLDARLSIMPTLNGEKAVIRVFESGDHDFELAKLGMTPATFEQYSDLLMRPHGTILLTGPTGSGKTTTLYASVREIIKKRGERTNIITIEDPIENEILGVNQVQVNPVRELSFAQGLRSILRQDPDVIMVGEVRDRETADICVRAGMTGHLVISSIHAESSVSVFNRLIEMGLESFLVSSAISCIVAQRLVRRNCPHCIKPYIPPLQALKTLKIPAGESIVYQKGVGCPKCNDRGFLGRIGIFELLIVDEELRGLLKQKAPTQDLQDTARRTGMRSLLDDGMDKVRSGVIDVEELARVLG